MMWYLVLWCGSRISPFKTEMRNLHMRGALCANNPKLRPAPGTALSQAELPCSSSSQRKHSYMD